MNHTDNLHMITEEPPIPYISLFSGAGGFDLGLEAVGFEARVCVDIDYHSCRSLAFNRSLGRRTGFHSLLKGSMTSCGSWSLSTNARRAFRMTRRGTRRTPDATSLTISLRALACTLRGLPSGEYVIPSPAGY